MNRSNVMSPLDVSRRTALGIVGASAATLGLFGRADLAMADDATPTVGGDVFTDESTVGSQTLSPLASDEIAVLGDEEFAPPPRPLKYRHTTYFVGTTEDNPQNNVEFPWNWTRLDHPELNDTPNAFISVTPVARIVVDESTGNGYIRGNPHAVGVIYREVTNRWYIYNMNGSSMGHGVQFNVVIEE